MIPILLIDDDHELATLLSALLAAQGFAVAHCDNGTDGKQQALARDHQLILLDVMLPGIDGLTLIRQLREQGLDTPVIMLSARGEPFDRTLGIELGADDYVPKPFDDRELVARMKALLRRQQRNQWQDDDISLNSEQNTVYCQGEQLSLTSAEFAILQLLLSHAGQIVSKEQLSEHALQRRLSSFDRSVDVHVSNVRKKLPPRQDGQERIKTHRGRGYQWQKY